MKRVIAFILVFCTAFFLCSCGRNTPMPQIVSTTKPVYAFTELLCNGTDLGVECLMSQNLSCLHEYTLQVNQLQKLENADVVIFSGAGLDESFLEYIKPNQITIDSSESIELLCAENAHEHDHSHKHDGDPHIWLSPENAKIMAKNIAAQLQIIYPEYKDVFNSNLTDLLQKLNDLQKYGEDILSDLSCRNLITFHDGFAYLADALDLNIIASIEEESGSEASAAKLVDLVTLVNHYSLPTIFTESTGSTAAAEIISFETGVSIYELDLAMASKDYFSAMYHNINTLQEALR